jgi:dolichol-phosphate mannosyltransferase
LRVWIIIPTYNERENIGELLDRITRVLGNKYDYYVLVVDDNSPDGTADIVKEYMSRNERVKLIIRREKRGLGSAILDGIKYVLENDPEATHFVTMDADLSHRPEDLPQMLRLAEKYDVVQGSRYVSGGRIIGWGFHRHLISKTANILIKLLYRTNIRDHTSNYRVYSRRAAELLLRYVSGKSYEWAIESILIPLAYGLKITESPIVFINRRKGSSKLGLGDIMKWWFSILAFRKKYSMIRSTGEINPPKS